MLLLVIVIVLADNYTRDADAKVPGDIRALVRKPRSKYEHEHEHEHRLTPEDPTSPRPRWASEDEFEDDYDLTNSEPRTLNSEPGTSGGVSRPRLSPVSAHFRWLSGTQGDHVLQGPP
jgi:hypothetical protein